MAKVKVQTPDNITALLRPRPEVTTDRRVWSIPLVGVVIPFLMASNTVGETAIPADALGHPLRLAKEKDGTPRFSANGRPVYRVAKEVADSVRTIRDNLIYSLTSFTATVRMAMPEQYKAQVEAARKAGEPLAMKDATDLEDYIATLSQAQAPSDNGQGVAQAQPERELVPA